MFLHRADPLDATPKGPRMNNTLTKKEREHLGVIKVMPSVVK